MLPPPLTESGSDSAFHQSPPTPPGSVRFEATVKNRCRTADRSLRADRERIQRDRAAGARGTDFVDRLVPSQEIVLEVEPGHGGKRIPVGVGVVVRVNQKVRAASQRRGVVGPDAVTPDDHLRDASGDAVVVNLRVQAAASHRGKIPGIAHGVVANDRIALDGERVDTGRQVERDGERMDAAAADVPGVCGDVVVRHRDRVHSALTRLQIRRDAAAEPFRSVVADRIAVAGAAHHDRLGAGAEPAAGGHEEAAAVRDGAASSRIGRRVAVEDVLGDRHRRDVGRADRIGEDGDPAAEPTGRSAGGIVHDRVFRDFDDARDPVLRRRPRTGRQPCSSALFSLIELNLIWAFSSSSVRYPPVARKIPPPAEEVVFPETMLFVITTAPNPQMPESPPFFTAKPEKVLKS
jgi:hypothetical protein